LIANDSATAKRSRPAISKRHGSLTAIKLPNAEEAAEEHTDFPKNPKHAKEQIQARLLNVYRM
jgi:hypothetical protein